MRLLCGPYDGSDSYAAWPPAERVDADLGVEAGSWLPMAAAFSDEVLGVIVPQATNGGLRGSLSVRACRWRAAHLALSV